MFEKKTPWIARASERVGDWSVLCDMGFMITAFLQEKTGYSSKIRIEGNHVLPHPTCFIQILERTCLLLTGT